MRKKKYSMLMILAIIGLFTISELNVYAAFCPNYGTSTESYELIYDGYVQCQPSYNENGQHAARGFFVYRNGAEGEKWWYTEYGMSITDSNIYSVSGRYVDTLNPIAPKVTFNYDFNYVPDGASYWPASIEIVE